MAQNSDDNFGALMGHDEKLNQRIREILKARKGIKEQNMFGGLWNNI